MLKFKNFLGAVTQPRCWETRSSLRVLNRPPPQCLLATDTTDTRPRWYVSQIVQCANQNAWIANEVSAVTEVSQVRLYNTFHFLLTQVVKRLHECCGRQKQRTAACNTANVQRLLSQRLTTYEWQIRLLLLLLLLTFLAYQNKTAGTEIKWSKNNDHDGVPHGVECSQEGECILPLKSNRQALEQEHRLSWFLRDCSDASTNFWDQLYGGQVPGTRSFNQCDFRFDLFFSFSFSFPVIFSF